MMWLVCLILYSSDDMGSKISTRFSHATGIRQTFLTKTAWLGLVVIHKSWLVTWWDFTAVHALSLASAQGFVIISERIKKDFDPVVDFPCEINLIVLPSSNEWVLKVRLIILLLLLFAFTVVFVCMKGFFEYFFNTWFGIEDSSTHPFIFECHIKFSFIGLHAFDFLFGFVLTRFDLFHEAVRSTIEIWFVVSINVKTFDLVLSSENSGTGFFSFSLWARRGFIKALCD